MNAIKAQDPLNEDAITECLENIVKAFVQFRNALKNFYGKLNTLNCFKIWLDGLLMK